MALALNKEADFTFGDTNTPLSSDFWFNQNGGLYEISDAARVSASSSNQTVSSTLKQPLLGPAVYAEATSEHDYGNFGNSWGIFVAAQNVTAVPGASNPCYLVRYQFNNFVPAFFRVGPNNPGNSEFYQISAGSSIPMIRGDALGLRATPVPTGVLLEATLNGVVVHSFVDTTPLPIGKFAGLRMSRSAQSGTAMSGTSRFVAGSLLAAPDSPLGGAVGLSAALKRGVRALRSRTVALASTLSTAALKRLSGDVALAGNLDAQRASSFVAVPKRVTLNRPLWNAFLRGPLFVAQLIETPQWRAALEGNAVIAGSIEEIRIDLAFTYDDTASLPAVADVRVGAGEWVPATVQKLSSARCQVSTLVGPLVRGTYPVQVRFVSGLQTPILFAGNLSVY